MPFKQLNWDEAAISNQWLAWELVICKRHEIITVFLLKYKCNHDVNLPYGTNRNTFHNEFMSTQLNFYQYSFWSTSANNHPIKSQFGTWWASPVVVLEKIKGPTIMVEGSHHLRKRPQPPPTLMGEDRTNLELGFVCFLPTSNLENAAEKLYWKYHTNV